MLLVCLWTQVQWESLMSNVHRLFKLNVYKCSKFLKLYLQKFTWFTWTLENILGRITDYFRIFYYTNLLFITNISVTEIVFIRIIISFNMVFINLACLPLSLSLILYKNMLNEYVCIHNVHIKTYKQFLKICILQITLSNVVRWCERTILPG